MPKIPKIAVAWLRKEDWARWQAIDSQLPPYERWLEKIESGIASAEGKGIAAEKVIVDPDEFMRWCEARSKPVHRDVRAQYAAEMLMKRSAH